MVKLIKELGFISFLHIQRGGLGTSTLFLASYNFRFNWCLFRTMESNTDLKCQTLPLYCREVRFASFLSGGFITAIVVNPLERKLAKRTSVYWSERAYHQKHGICGALHPRLAFCQWTSDIYLRSLR